MKKCCEFIIEDPEALINWSFESDFEYAQANIWPIHDILSASFPNISEISKGKPWGAGFEITEGKCCVSFYLINIPSSDNQRFEGSISIDTGTTTLRTLLHLNDKKAEEALLEKVFPIYKKAVERENKFRGLRWLTFNEYCSKSRYGEE